ncbi:hypothetical protein DNU06_08105 [Putridiphycobacter roseus]|uniref:histidine kinase n=1 Tax=Putridiphycobacter roseus TaxID=2219161 RepID=A0A2W1MZ90_9FLAO|nr:PAS domain S-box protein [Putridiphycobacter roseus]PZE17227.1 hypothetical protein DNU06_08105 [Putridiphycobacter roseus]
MKNLLKSIKKRYIIYVAIIIVIVIAFLVVIQNSITTQKHYNQIINSYKNQRTLSQDIVNLATYFGSNLTKDEAINASNTLKILTNEIDRNHQNLAIENNKNSYLDSLHKISERYLTQMVSASRNIATQTDSITSKNEAIYISAAILPYLSSLDVILNEYQVNSEHNLRFLLYTFYFLALIIGFVLLAEFLFVLMPALNQLVDQNKNLTRANNQLAKSENKINTNLIELRKLKIDLELKEKYNKIFIEQSPTAIAMLDNDMHYIAVSQQWIRDFKMEGIKVIGRSHYDLFPEIEADWRLIYLKCLGGEIDTCEEVQFKRADGSVQWIFWDIRPWFISHEKIGGLLMHTGDITPTKEKEIERLRYEKILENTNVIAKIGTWEVDLVTNKVFWSSMVHQIHETPKGYQPTLDNSIHFYKEGKSRDTIIKVVQQAMETGIAYDVEVELITYLDNPVWVRAIGQAEIINGECVRIFGVFQDISEKKLSQIALIQANTKLKAIFNAGTIAIVSTDNNGIINYFNHGAEKLLGYTAKEMVGIKAPESYHNEAELEQFKKDKAKEYGMDPTAINPFVEMGKRDKFDTREWTYTRKDGTTFPVELTLTSIKNDLGEKVGFLGVSLDITERRNKENELLKKNKLLNFAETITLLGNWQWNIITNEVQWSNNLYNIFQLDKETLHLNFDTYFSHVHPQDKVAVTDHFNNAIKLKNLTSFTHRIIAGDGKTKTIQLLGEVITNNQGEVIEMIGTCQDVTMQKVAENKFRGLLESAPDAMVIVNEKGIIQLVNKQAVKLFGYPAVELFGKSVEILIPKRFAGSHPGSRSGFFANPKTRIMGQGKELYGVHKKGEEIPIQISLSPLKTEEGLLVSAAIRDITAQKLAEDKILESKEDLEILANQLTTQNTQLADFAHITSHNLRAPVSNLNSLVEIYHAAESEDEKNMLFLKFEKVIHHLTFTLNTLVDTIKIRNETAMEFNMIPFDEILNTTKDILAGELIKSGIIITSDFSKVEKIYYNKVYLESIFLNLVGNAIKYRAEDRVPELFIQTQISDGKISISFKDNGLGIDLKMHGHKLFGLNKVFHRHPEAKGVGLFMTKTQIEAMGGKIWATSEVNVGTSFNINFQE